MGNVDCALTTEGYGDYDKKRTQYSWFVHELLEKEFFGKTYNDPRGQYSLESADKPGFFMQAVLKWDQMTFEIHDIKKTDPRVKFTSFLF